MAILVTGCAGFIGMHVALALLEAGERVIGIDNLTPYYDVRLKEARLRRLHQAGGDFRFHRIDFADSSALREGLRGEQFDEIIHLGAQAGVRHSLEAPEAYVSSNLVGHANILELARARAVRHLVYASSSSVYGGGTQLPMSTDQRAHRPMSLYAATKRADELLSESYAHLFAIPQTGLRFFTVYGPWGRPDMAVWLFTQAIFEGRPIRLFNGGEMRRDFTFIDDVVAGILLARAKPPADDGLPKPGGSHGPHAIYNIGNDRSEELGRLVRLIETEAKRSAIVEHAPLQPGDLIDTRADIEDLREATGFSPKVELDEGIRRFVSWYSDYVGSTLTKDRVHDFG